MKLIDAHVHLWKKQDGIANGQLVFPLANGKSNFAGEIRQMLPPYMTDNKNTAERLVANMDYAGVSAAIVTQEEIDGNQNRYLLQAKEAYPRRLKICSLYQEKHILHTAGFDGIKLCAGRLHTQDLQKHADVFATAAKNRQFVSIDLADGGRQTGALSELAQSYPDLRIAIGHFGMVTRPEWKRQIQLAAQHKNVFIESGGITWLFNHEFYPYPSAVRAIREAADVCGFEKLMWGSDYPRTMVEITYKMSYDYIIKSKELSEEEKAAFLWKNAKEFYGFSDLYTCEKIKNMLED